MPLDQAMAQAAALYGAGELDAAMAMCAGILRADPRHFWALHLSGTIALRREEFEASIDFASRALAVDPRNVQALCNRGAGLRRLNRIEEALADYDRALAIKPDLAAAHNNRGIALAALNRHLEAIESYSRALAFDPGDADARLHRALSLLTIGDFARGWADHGARGLRTREQGPNRTMARPLWTGRESLQGKRIVLHAEQGLGDTLQFVRYAAGVKRLGATVYLEVHAPLAALLSRVEGVDRAIVFGDPLPEYDFHCPLLCLPQAFGTRLESIPSPGAYVSAPAGHIARWEERLASLPRPRIGLAWSGNPRLFNDRNRSIPLATLAPLRSVDASVLSLQSEVRERDREALAAPPALPHFAHGIADFRDTAAIIAQLDLVISVDTSVAHLAGSMGKEVWILLPFCPDWRYLLDREDSPWYPSARLFRQPGIGDWDRVVQRVAREAAAFARGVRPA